MKHFFIFLSAILGCSFIYAQNVGINTKTPQASFNVAEGQTVLFGTDTTGIENKLMWLPIKAAFRVGYYNGISNDTIGIYSTAFGASIANGIASTAMGSSTSSGYYSTAMGQSVANGYGSAAMGRSTASGFGSTAMGWNANASSNYSTAIGNSVYAKSINETAIGTYNDTSNTNRLFEIGNGSSGALQNALTVLNTGQVGVATTAPQAPFTVAANNTVLFGSDTTSEGNKLIWFPIKGAFRAGKYFGSIIDPISSYSTAMGQSTASGQSSSALGFSSAIGQYSSALGYSATFGNYSSAMGYQSVANGYASTAMGYYSIADSAYSTAVGQSTASGIYSTAMGQSAASGEYSTAMGQSYASGLYSTAMGFSIAKGQYSTAMGDYSTASGNYSTAISEGIASGTASTAMGNGTASGDYSTAMGVSTASGGYSTSMGVSTASGQYSTAMGFFTNAKSTNETVIGTYNDTINTNRLFEIGDGTAGSLQNALTVLNNGQVGIGTVYPNALLELKYSSQSAYSQLLLNQTGSDPSARLSFQNTLGASWTIAVSRNSSSASDAIIFNDAQLGQNRFWFYGNGNATFAGTLTQNSDERLKTNIHCIKEVLPELKSINAYTYNWKEKNRGDDEQIGFLAQEIEKTFPQLVRTDEKGIKSVAYQNMVPILLQAIKEQQAEIEAQKKQNELQQKQLEEKNNLLQSKLNDVTAKLEVLQEQVETLAKLQKTNSSLTAKDK